MCGCSQAGPSGSRQIWVLLAPETQQSRAFDVSRISGPMQNCKLTRTFANPALRDWNPWLYLACPVSTPIVSTIQPLYPSTQCLSTGTQMKTATLGVLTEELIHSIIEYLVPSTIDLLAFALTSYRNWQVSVEHIQSLYRKAREPLAEKILTLLGDWATTLPEPLTEVGGLVRSLIIASGQKPDEKPLIMVPQFFELTWKWKAPVTTQTLEQNFKHSMSKWKREAGIPPEVWKRLRRNLNCPKLIPRDRRDWVLRNLTTNETISSENGAFVTPGKNYDCWKSKDTSDAVYLMDLLLMRICWGPKGSGWAEDREGEEVPHQGIWAGHRFDLVTLSDHNSEGTTEKWKNITVEVVNEVKLLREMVNSR